MREIQLKDAKSKFSAVVDDAVNGDGAIITRHGKKEAVVISYKEFERLSKAVPSFGWLLTPFAIGGGRFAGTQALAGLRQRLPLMYLVDTSIVSLFAPSRKLGSAEMGIAEWLQRASDHLHLSVVTASEIETGIARLNRAGATAKASALAAWLEAIVSLYGARIHALDIETARLAGQLYDRAVGNGQTPSFPDAAIAATAQIRRLTIITRNAAHFAPFATPYLNPYDGIPVNE